MIGSFREADRGTYRKVVIAGLAGGIAVALLLIGSSSELRGTIAAYHEPPPVVINALSAKSH